MRKEVKMTDNDRLDYLINYLINERKDLEGLDIPNDQTGKRKLLRSLMNVRMPDPISEEFLKIQDEYLMEINREKGEVSVEELNPIKEGIYLWQGDITRLAADAIVNAANSQMLGCFIPCHGCIDNVTHSYAGVQLRLECAEIMERQGHKEPVGEAKLTHAYNLPCKYVIHTVGPMITGKLREKDCELLASCYSSCFELARIHGLKNIAFCCISTGEFRFPHQKAAEIAIDTVEKCRKDAKECPEVIFNVFKDSDYSIYRELLG